MAIANRHIRWDWNTWLDTDRAKTKTMCGRYTSTKYSGIPGITSQRRFIPHPQRGLLPGWCEDCAYATYKQMLSLPRLLPTNNEVNKLYKRCFEIISEYAAKVAKARGEDFERPTFPRKPGSGKQKDLIGKLNFLSGAYPNCYLCGNPGGNEVDHIVPLSRGGEDEIWNVAKVHAECNAKKRDLPLSELPSVFPNMQLPKWFEL